MKIPISWLKQYVNFQLSPREVAEKLTLLGIEVEGITDTALTFEGVVVAKVVSAEAHPNADRLRVARVNDGAQEYQVVCGADNCRAGITVAFAPIGAKLTDQEGKPWKIKKSKIRDVESQGMLCSETELGLAATSPGIIELPTDWSLGANLASFYSNPILEISLTPNLGHCMSMLGIARELAASLNTVAKRPHFSLQTEGKSSLSIEIKEPDLCPFYTCRLIRNVRIGPSPEWLVQRLKSASLRPINNIIDVTNFVMLELGQPLHAFDADTIDQKKIVVASTPSATSFRTLDEKEREVPPRTLLICDGEKPVAIAGIMGGNASMASEKTQNILLEAALFAPAAIRKASRLLDLKTDASHRFDKGIDPQLVTFALDRASALIQEIAGGVAEPAISQGSLPARKKIPLRVERINALLGTELSQNEISLLLGLLEMTVLSPYTVEIPSYRNDLNTEIDLVEEVARLFGYNNLPKKHSLHISSPLTDTPLYLFEQEMRASLLKEGLQECITCDLISPHLAQLTAEKAEPTPIAVLHPRSVDQSILRISLMPGLLQVAKTNFNHQTRDLALFEIGRIHFKEGDAFQEQVCAAILLSGKSSPYHFDPKPRPFDFFDLKGMVENLLSLKVSFEPSHLHTLHPGRQSKVMVGPLHLGVIGQIHPNLAHALDLDGALLFAEINLNDLMSLKKGDKKSTPLAPFPGSERDWTLSLKNETPVAAVIKAIESARSPLLEGFFLLDLYPKEGSKNVTFRFTYRDAQKTIDLETVEREHQKLTQVVAEKLRDALILT
jgi:phenylalanyl-tRNA synthetase beta chain